LVGSGRPNRFHTWLFSFGAGYPVGETLLKKFSEVIDFMQCSSVDGAIIVVSLANLPCLEIEVR